MTRKPLHAGLNAALEFGPTLGFVAAYLILRNKTYVIAGTEYSSFVAITAAFIPVFLIAIGLLWYLTGRIARIQVATAVMVVVFGGLSVWFNDPRFFKVKPTAVYLCLALVLGIGLLRGRLWLRYIMQDMLPMHPKGWRILTKRMIALFLASAAANELVWRTQSEATWVFFETLVMPVLVVAFFLTQIGLYVDYAKWGPSQKRRGVKKHGRGADKT